MVALHILLCISNIVIYRDHIFIAIQLAYVFCIAQVVNMDVESLVEGSIIQPSCIPIPWAAHGVLGVAVFETASPSNC